MIRDELLKQTEEILSILSDFPDSPARKVQEAMRYTLLGGGKRIRPVLLGLTALSLGCDGKELAPFMAAIEIIHSASLVHDDLPALDNDSLRRGRPTVHVAYGEDAAILAGDALINLAYETLLTACRTEAEELTKDPSAPVNGKALVNGAAPMEGSSAKGEMLCRKVRAASILAKAGGITGMLGGQSADVVLSGRKLSEEERDYIYLNKTGALIMAPMEAGAVLAGAPEEAVRLSREAGRNIGLAFQVQDDILDVTGDEQSLGKEAGQDERNDKSTYVSAYGLEEAARFVEEKTRAALDALESMRGLADVKEEAFSELKELAASLAGRKA